MRKIRWSVEMVSWNSNTLWPTTIAEREGVIMVGDDTDDDEIDEMVAAEARHYVRWYWREDEESEGGEK